MNFFGRAFETQPSEDIVLKTSLLRSSTLLGQFILSNVTLAAISFFYNP